MGISIVMKPPGLSIDQLDVRQEGITLYSLLSSLRNSISVKVIKL